VVHPHLLTRREHIETDSNLGKIRFAFEVQTFSSPLLVAPAAVTGVQDEPALRAWHKPSFGLFGRRLGNHRRIIARAIRLRGSGHDHGVETTHEAVAERVTGGRPSRFKSFLAATAIGVTAATLTYRLLRRDRPGNSEA
jgi:hypothetical protein